VDDYQGDVIARKSAVVINLDDTAAFLRDDGSEARKTTGTIADGNCHAVEASVVRETAFEDAPERGCIDISAAERHNHFLAFELRQEPGEARSESGGASAFDHGFLQFDETKDREREIVLIHEDNFVHESAGCFEGVCADFRNGKAVRERWFHVDLDRAARAESGGEAGAAFRLHADDSDIWFEMAEGSADAGDQSCAADRNDNRIEIGDLLKNLKSDRSLSCDDGRVVETVDVSESFFGNQLIGAGASLAKGSAVKNDARAKATTIRDLRERRESRHHNRDRHS
jgi:hypothetical protein